MVKNMKKKKKKKLKMKSWMKFHAAFTICLLLFYVALGTVGGGLSMLGNDLKGKVAAADTTISAIIDAQPGKPILSALTSCLGNTSIVNLTWTGSDGATSNIIKRDGDTLASGFQDMFYDDATVLDGYDFSYVVTASGASGTATSDPLIMKAKDCGNAPLPDPLITLVSFDGKGVAPGQSLSTTRNTFKITGTTNMPNAHMQIKTLPGNIFNSTLNANSTGYWEYYLPGQLAIGTYSFEIKATDDNVAARNVTQNYPFQIVRESGGGGDDDDHHHGGNNSSSTTIVTSGITQTPQGDGGSTNTPGDQNTTPEENVTQSPDVSNGSITIQLKNKDGKVYRSQDMLMLMTFDGMDRLLANEGKINLKYEIIDEKGVIAYTGTVAEKITANKLDKTIHIPENLSIGNYKIRVSVLSGGKTWSGESDFSFAEMPIVNFGGGITMTYSELVNEAGWVAVVAAMLLLIFGSMFILEIYFFEKAIMTVAEDSLIKGGIISIRKGVSS
jgi:hypothetical protein